MVKLTDRPDMTLDVYRERKTTTQQLVDHCDLYFMVQGVVGWCEGAG